MKKAKILTALLITLSLFLTANSFAQGAPFNDIDTVTLGPQDGILFDTYVIGEGSQSMTATRWITQFKMNKYETTYNLWYIVRLYAEQKGYVFSNPGQEGSYGRRGKAPTKEGMYQPVTMISWYDAVVWCNALSEMMGRKPCYSYNTQIVKDATDTASLDLCVCDWDADGYRLPTEAEWEYAARKTSSGFQSGSLVSGQIDDNGFDDSNAEEGKTAWFDGNTNNSHTVGTAGTVFTEEYASQAAAGTGCANGAGVYDMSGNVLELCWDWYEVYKDTTPGERASGPQFGSERVGRGGSWSGYTGFIYAGDRYSYDPNEAYNYMGFRFVTSR